MPQACIPKRRFAHTLAILLLWLVFYGSFTLVTPALLDDADSVHAEVAREMLARHDWVTLYANGIRYLEKAPLLYWAMAASMRLSQLLGHTSAAALATAARLPLALTVLALAFVVAAFGRRCFHPREQALSLYRPEEETVAQRAGFYAALILLSSFGIFLFTRILIPDAMLCLWLTLALFCFWLTEREGTAAIASSSSGVETADAPAERLPCLAFAACCALGVLTKGLIGALFPAAIAGVYLLLTRGRHGAVARIRQLHPLAAAAVFFALAAPWHILIALANPAQGHPGGLSFTLHPAAGTSHWQVPLPTDGNVHGWAWFYFVNEQLLRYLNLRVPRDYDTVPLWLFWGLCLVWLMPWSAFLFKAVAHAIRRARRELAAHATQPSRASANPALLLLLWAAIPLLFFSLSTRQEYYVLPSLPAFAILLAGWLAEDDRPSSDLAVSQSQANRRPNLRCTALLAVLGGLFAAATACVLVRTHSSAAGGDLAALLHRNPGDYAMSMGHFLDLDLRALALFRVPLAIAAASLLLGPLASYLLRRRASCKDSTRNAHAATLALAAGAFGFLFAAHLGLRTFAPVLSSQQLAQAIAPQLLLHPGEPAPLIVIHQEYEYASTLGFYLQQPAYRFSAGGMPVALNPLHILTDANHNGTTDYGRSSNLWYGSFFPDAPPIFETAQSLAAKWSGSRRIFLWQDLAGDPSASPPMPGPVYVIARSGGKEIVSNQPNR